MYSVKGLGGKGQLGFGRERGFELVVAINSLKEPVYVGKPRRTGTKQLDFVFDHHSLLRRCGLRIDTILKLSPHAISSPTHPLQAV